MIVGNDIAILVVNYPGAQATVGPLLGDTFEEALEKLPERVMLAAREARYSRADLSLLDLSGGDVDNRWFLSLGNFDESVKAELRRRDRTEPDQYHSCGHTRLAEVAENSLRYHSLLLLKL